MRIDRAIAILVLFGSLAACAVETGRSVGAGTASVPPAVSSPVASPVEMLPEACRAALMSQPVSGPSIFSPAASNRRTTKLGRIPGECGDAYTSLHFDLRFSPDGRAFAYRVPVGLHGQPYKPPASCREYSDCHILPPPTAVVIGNAVTQIYAETGTLIYGANGKTLAYSVRLKDQVGIVMHDRATGQDTHYAAPGKILSYSLSPDGEKVACVATFREQGRDKFAIVENGRTIATSAESTPLAYRQDGELVYVLCELSMGSKCVLVNGSRKTSVKKKGGVFELAVSHDGESLAYVTGSESEKTVVFNGQESLLHSSVQGLRVSPDGKRVAYIANGNRMIIDQQERLEHDVVGTPSFSPNSQRVSYVAESAQGEWVLVNGYERVPGYRNWWAHAPVVSPTGRHVAYVAFGDWPPTEWFVVLEGTKLPAYDYIDPLSLRFTPDGTLLMYGARKGRELWWMTQPVK